MLGPLEDVLARPEILPADDYERLEAAHRNALRLLKLVNTLLDFSRIESGRIDARFAPTDLARLTADLASTFRSAIESAGLRLLVDCPPLPEPVYVDQELWEQIVLNLLSNAFKFTFAGTITVALSAINGSVELSVTDTGTGIPADELPHIFERFHRVKDARGRTFEGSGIGLALVQDLVHLHGGTVQVTSVIDQGTRFSIQLPLGMAHLPAERIQITPHIVNGERRQTAFVEEALHWLPNEQAANVAQNDSSVDNLAVDRAASSRARILLADDNADMRAYIKRLLSRTYDIETVTDGAAALTLARTQPFDLILTDVMMPKLDGFGLIAALRADARTQTLPVIVLSARAGEEARIAGMQAGADEYLVKPFSANELLARIQSTLALARLRRDAEARLTALQQLTASFADTHSLAEVRHVIVQEVTQVLGAQGGGVRRVVDQHLVLDEFATSAQLNDEEVQRYAALPLTLHHPATDAVRNGEAVFFHDAPDLVQRYPELAALVAKHYTRASAHLPLWRGHELFGLLSLHFDAPQRWDEVERNFALVVADRAAVAYERARLFDAERRARARAERLQAVTVALSNATTPGAVYEAVLSHGLNSAESGENELRAQSGTLYLCEGDTLKLAGWQQANAALVDHYRSFSLGAAVPAAEAVRTSQPIWLGSRSAFIQRYPHLTEHILALKSEAAVSLPLLIEGRVLGVLNFTFPQPVVFDSDNRQFLLALAAQAAQAIERTSLFTAMQSSQAQLAAFMQHSSGSLFIKDTAGRYILVNQAFLTAINKTADELIGKTDHELFPPELAEIFVAEDAQVRSSGQPQRFEESFIYDGTIYTFLSQKFPLPNDSIGCVVTDITDRKRFEVERERLLAQERAARAQAEEASRLKDEFLATVSHELRTPLTAFLGYAQMLQMRQRDAAYIARTVDKMVRSAQAQAQLIDDLLDISRIVSGKIRIDSAPVDLTDVVLAALDTVRPAVEAKQLRIDLALNATAGHVIGDSNRLQQVVWNLLSNAAKFTPQGGTITIELVQHEGLVQLTVSDTGQGIPSTFLPYVFDRFRQADGTTQRVHGGLGLGLAIVRHLVELHGGKVQVASAGEGQGATFTVLLPAAIESAQAARLLEGQIDLACPPELKGLRVLIIDDQPDLLEVLQEVLASCGALVRTCTNAREALDLLRAWRPIVLVSDIAMPGNDGYWLIEQLRALPPEQGGTTPAVALTAYVRMEDRLRVLASGFEHYIPKPVDPAELRAVVAQLSHRVQR
jgi:PAS domain S-box-containing protein